jgi:hypothetical protein
LIDLPLPDRQDVLIGEIKLPDFPRDTGPRALLGGTAASFADLGFKTVTLGSSLEPANTFPTAGRSSGTAEILKTSTDLDFWVPAGFYPGRHQEGIIALDFSYGAKLRSDSVLNIALNGIFVRAIPLDDPVGATQLGYQVRFPFELLVAGRNQLTLSPRMVPSFTDVCQLRQGENLRFTLFESSSVMLPDVERIVSLPDLGVFSRAGFPLLENPTGSEFGVQFGSRHPATVAAAWTLLGRLAQLVQIPLYRAELSYDPFPDKFSWLLVAPITDVDVELRADSPILERDGRFWVKYPLLDLVQPLKPEGNWAERGLARLQRLFEPPASVVDVREADVGFEDAERTSPLSATVFGRQGGLFQLQAESAQKTPVVMLTAATPELLHARAARLVQPDFWYNLSGGFALWDDREDSLTTVRTKHRFTVGQVSPPDRLNFLLNTYPEALVAIVLLLILLFASLLFAVVRRFRRHARIVSATED